MKKLAENSRKQERARRAASNKGVALFLCYIVLNNTHKYPNMLHIPCKYITFASELKQKKGKSMKANELMIGDWVYDNEHQQKPIRVKGYYTHVNTAELLSPIPLTEEILKANGYYNRGAMFYGTSSLPTMAKYNESEWILSYGERGDKPFLVSLYISYVHELQHLLRLCGLNDLADNFKLN